MGNMSSQKKTVGSIGVARAFPGGQTAHPEDQNEEENHKKFEENVRNYRKMRKDWGNILILPTREWEAMATALVGSPLARRNKQVKNINAKHPRAAFNC